jgi:MOSC domain-containing protein YiiM
MQGSVVAIYVADKGGAALRAVPLAVLQAGRGIVGDRYFLQEGTFSAKLRNGQDWEVTLIEMEEVDRFNASVGKELAAGSFRRNIVTAGVRLNELVGKRFQVGNAVLEGMRLCEPCAYLAGLIGPEVVRAMAHRAGLRARILVGAEVARGQDVTSADCLETGTRAS